MKSGLYGVPLVLALATSCWLPQEFEARLSIEEDGAFTFEYEGELTNWWIAQAAAEGSLGSQDEAEMKSLEDEFKSEPEFKSVEYLGGGRFRVSYTGSGEAGAAFTFLNEESEIFSMRPGPDGTLEIRGMELDEDDLRELEEARFEIRGRLTVDTDAEVLTHNATAEPRFFGLVGDYEWTFRSNADPPPFMRLRIG